MDDEDRKAFLEVLCQVNKRFNWLCHAYCLMNNHYHLIIETPDGNLSKGMRQLNGVYTQRFNRRYRRVGHIFQGRYKAIVIEKESYLSEVSRYVVLNPVRAKAVRKPEEWQWSSYRGTAGLEQPHPCLTADWIVGQFDTRRRRAEMKYREFVEAGIREKGIWEEVKGQSILGEDDFVERLIGYVKGHEDIREIPKSQRYVGRPSLSTLFEGAMSADNRIRASRIRKAVIGHGYSLKDVADFLKIHYSTVSRTISKTDYARNKT
jgi:REP element-mobilizing transposase RayT